MDKIELLNKMIEESKFIVFFGGAGVSTESGLKDFRSKDGLYNEEYKYSPEEILSAHFFIENPREFFRFYKQKMNSTKAEPNITHKKLVELEQSGKLKSIITQNIDGLHQRAGSKNVIELHGSVLRNYCENCHKFYDETKIFDETDEIPVCLCGGIIKPDVVLYEESLDDRNMKQAIKNISEADLLIVGGTSLTVYPARSFLEFFQGKYIVLINKDKTEYDTCANLVIQDNIGNVFQQIKERK